MIDSPENEAVVRAQMGDTDALDDLMNRFERLNRANGSRYAPPGTDTDDFVQEARIGTWKAIQKFNPARASLMSWACYYAFSYAQNENGRQRRQSIHYKLSTDDLGLEREPSAEPSPERLAMLKGLAAEIQRLVISCPDMDGTDREIFRRRILPGREESQTLDSMGAELGMSRESLRQREVKLKTVVLPRVFAALRDL